VGFTEKEAGRTAKMYAAEELRRMLWLVRESKES
jgi:hypothetical protein